MSKNILIYLTIFICSFSTIAQNYEDDLVTSTETDSTDTLDGPYIFIEGEKLIEKTIKDGEVISRELAKNLYPLQFKRSKSTFKNVSEVAALSDIHGQYDLAIKILKNNKVIDEDLKWNFGNGHLVIVGDIFDRGPKVNELLWFVYNLEQEAATKGGAVHYLLGNHEYMVLQGDMRYINPRYRQTMRLLEKNYDELYSNNTVIGRWLRSKPTVIKINDVTYVHGGLSKEFLEDGLKMDKANEYMTKFIDTPDSLIVSDLEEKYFSESGPIWYRGYFQDNLSDEDVSEILKMSKTNHIVVGHCSNDHVVNLYDGKIYGVDSSIKNGEYGELLFIKGNDYKRGTLEGEIKDFSKEEESKPTSNQEN